MDIRLNEEQTMIRETVRDIARDRIAPRAAEIDRTGEFPWDVVDLFRKHDLFALPFPPEYGGLSGSALTLNVAIEEVAKVCATSALILAVQALGGYPLMIAGTEEQKARLLPDLASGAKLSAYALSEPGAGSDPAGMQTRADRHGDEYVITGSKIWITSRWYRGHDHRLRQDRPERACQGGERVRPRGRAASQGVRCEHDPRQARDPRQQHRGTAIR